MSRSIMRKLFHNFKSFIIIVIVTSILSLQEKKPLTVNEFVQSQTSTYKISPGINSLSFAATLANLPLHYQSKATALKALKPHSSPLVDNKKVYSRIDIWQFDYENEVLCKAAQDSLLLCFPYDCTRLNFGVDQSIKVTPCIFIFGQSTIAFAHTSCEQVDSKWTQFTKDFTQYYAEEESKIIVGSCGKIQWLRRSEILNNSK